jgi:hypothetical protein
MAAMQSYENHAQRVPVMLTICFVFLVAFFWQTYQLIVHPGVGQFISVLVAASLVLLPFVQRRFTLRVQDRLIRLEMRMRLREILAAPMHGQIHAIAPRHLVALRFAGDDELPALVSEVISNPSLTPKEIKQRIKHWQADHLRA